MVPGLPAGETDPTSAPKEIAPSMSDSSTITSIQETLEDIRDAVVETDAYVSLVKHAGTARRTASSAWRLTKNVAWIVGTSALILVVPLLYEIDKELGPTADANGQPQLQAPSTDSSTTAPAAGAADSATPAVEASS